MAFAIPRPSTAFADTAPKVKKKQRQNIEAHLRFIRSLPCLVTGARPVEAAHIRYADMRYGKRLTGTGEKPDDHWVVPLSPASHRDQHAAGDELAWWKSKGIDPLFVALALWRATGDEDVAEQIIRENRP
jgi:hypothetical protein